MMNENARPSRLHGSAQCVSGEVQEAHGMKNTLLCVIAWMTLLCVSPVRADTFTYDNVNFRQQDIIGYIQTDCNNCTLLRSDIVGWNLTITTPGGKSPTTLSSSNSYVIDTTTD